MSQTFFDGEPSAVFDWLQTPANWRVVDSVVAASGSGRPGDVTTLTWLVGGKPREVHYDVVEYDPPRRVLNKSRDEHPTVEELTFAERRGGTVVTSTLTTDHGRRLGLFTIARMKRAAVKRTKRELDQMAAAFRHRGVPARRTDDPAQDPIGPYLQDD